MKFPVAVRWSASPRATLAYALARRVAASPARPLVDPSLADTLDALLHEPPLAELIARASTNALEPPIVDELLDLAAALGAEDDDGPPALDQSMARESVSHFQASRFPASRFSSAPRLVAALSGALSGAFASCADKPGWRPTELRLRIGPLREQWEARGPGLLRQVVLRALDQGWQERESGSTNEPQRVIIMAPVTGGGGRACPHRNVVLFEGLLANPWRQLPEIARLAWLLAQNLLTPPRDGRSRAAEHDAHTALDATELADIVLAAGEIVELNQDDEATRQLARRNWL